MGVCVEVMWRYGCVEWLELMWKSVGVECMGGACDVEVWVCGVGVGVWSGWSLCKPRQVQHFNYSYALPIAIS